MNESERITPEQIHDLMEIGDGIDVGDFNAEHRRRRGDLADLQRKGMIEWNQRPSQAEAGGRWQLLDHGRLAIHGLTSCEAPGCVAKHSFDYVEKPKRKQIARALKSLIFNAQGMLDGVQLHPDLFDEEVIEALEGSLLSANRILDLEGA
jgi:hypothetical protein